MIYILYLYGFAHFIMWLIFGGLSFGLFKEAKTKINYVNLPIIIMILTVCLLLTKVSLLGNIYSLIYFGFGLFFGILEIILLNLDDNKNKMSNIEKILQVLVVTLFLPQHLLFAVAWKNAYQLYEENEKSKH